MIDDWFHTIELKITFEEFERLPRTVGYKHEYFDGCCVLTPRPRNCYAVLDLARFQPPPPMASSEKVSLRPLQEIDWKSLGELCGFAFHRVPPFGSLTDEEKEAAGKDCMNYVRDGNDGPFISEASFVAVDEENNPCGAMLIVLKPPGYRDDPWRHYRWRQPPAPDAIATRAGQAHLDWVFVSPWLLNHGIGSAMLASSVEKLRALGFETLTSSFMLGNGESMAWHWRNGFVLLPNPASMRYFERRMKDAGVNPTKP